MKKAFLLLATLLLTSPATLLSADTTQPVKPNILFIMADDFGWTDLGCYGSKFHQTPNLDKLAARGVKFTQAYAANPLCSPTRSSVLTGLWPARTGITAPVCHLPQVILDKQLSKGNPNQPVLVANSITRLKTDYVTLPKVLCEAGYRTGHFGKWHLGPEPYSALQHGFDVDWPHWPGPGPAGSYVAPWKFPASLKVEGKAGEHIEDTLSSHVVKFIRENKDRPFYANYWQFSVHSPNDAKDELVAKYRKLADPKNPQRNPVYASMVESLDDGVGRVLAALDECGIADKTIIVFFSDNGGVSWAGKDGDAEHKSARFQADMKSPPTSNLPLRNGKASLYEGGVREPCLIVWPGIAKAGTVNDTVIQSIDWMPTLLDMVGVPLPKNVKPDGISITPAIKGGTLARDTIFTHFPHDTPASGQHPGTSVRRGDWKLIRLFAQNDDGSDQFELFNLRDDLGETKNVAAEKPELLRELNSLITKFLADTEAVVPIRNPSYNPGAAKKPDAKPAAAADPLQGWKARSCEAVVKDGMVTSCQALAHADVSTVRDPSFEKIPIGSLSESGRVEQGWEIQKTGRPIIKPRLRAEGIEDPHRAKSGTRCLALTIPADTVGFEFMTVGQRVQLAAGKEYEAGVWVRWPDGPDTAPADASATNGKRSAIVSFWARHRDGNGDFAGRDEWVFDNQWHRLTFRFRATEPEQRTLVYVSLLPNQKPAETTVLLDDFELRELDEPTETETRTGSLALDADFSAQKTGPASPPWYFANLGGKGIRGEMVTEGKDVHFRMAMNRGTSNFESAQMWQHVALREGVRYDVSCRMRWDDFASDAPAPIVNFGIYHEATRTWYGPVDQVLEKTGDWRTYRFKHIPPFPGPWKLYVQLNGWGNFANGVTVSFDDFVCQPSTR